MSPYYIDLRSLFLRSLWYPKCQTLAELSVDAKRRQKVVAIAACGRGRGQRPPRLDGALQLHAKCIDRFEGLQQLQG